MVVWLQTVSALSAPITGFPVEPYDIDGGVRNSQGLFRENGGPEEFRVFLGIEPGNRDFTLNFETSFIDGPGDDFAILSAEQIVGVWGPFADTAKFDLYLNGLLVSSFTASLEPATINHFDLPGSGIIANQIVVTNVTPSPPPPFNNAVVQMAFDNAGVAHLLPEPSTEVFLVAALGMLLSRRSRSNCTQ
jgi:hypothetical protein